MIIMNRGECHNRKLTDTFRLVECMYKIKTHSEEVTHKSFFYNEVTNHRLNGDGEANGITML